jgi:multidrug resistance efflux pump
VRQLLVAVAILVVGALIAWFTFTEVTGQTSYSGTVEPQQLANLDFKQTGRIAQILVQPGDHVTVGQPVATQDQEGAKAALADAQAVLSADQAKLTALQSPSLSDATKQTLASQVAQASAQLASAKQALADANAEASAEVGKAQQTLDEQTATLNADKAQYNDQCPDGPDSDRCTKLQSQVQQDTAAVNAAATNLDRTKATATQRQDAAAGAVSSASATLAMRQNQQASATAPATAADLSAAQADVASAQLAVDQAKNTLNELTLLSPIDGTVALVGGIVGELDGTDGVHGFSGPQSLQSDSGPGFALFPPAAGAGSGQNSSSSPQPLISLVSSQHNALAQVGEGAMPRLHPGSTARVTVNALHATVNATVRQVIPIPVSQDGSVEYKVRMTVAAWPNGTQPGMSLSVVFS